MPTEITHLTFPRTNWLEVPVELATKLTEWASEQPVLPDSPESRLDYAISVGAELRQIPGFGSFLEQLRTRYADYGACVVSGLPVQNAQPLALAIGANLQQLALGLGNLPSDIIITVDEQAKYEAAHQQTFELHVDYAFVPEPPDTTVIFCIKPDPGYPQYGVSYLVGADDIIAALKAQERNDLLDFAMNVPVKFTHDNDPSQNAITPIIRLMDGEIDRYRICYRRRFMPRDFVEKYEATLTEFERFTHALAMEFVLNAGDMLILNNLRFVHGRGPSTLAYDENGQVIARHVLSTWGNYNPL